MRMLDRLGDFERSHRNGELRMEHVGRKVRLQGWCRHCSLSPYCEFR